LLKDISKRLNKIIFYENFNIRLTEFTVTNAL